MKVLRAFLNLDDLISVKTNFALELYLYISKAFSTKNECHDSLG